jgi:hypothetical protein
MRGSNASCTTTHHKQVSFQTPCSTSIPGFTLCIQEFTYQSYFDVVEKQLL